MNSEPFRLLLLLYVSSLAFLPEAQTQKGKEEEASIVPGSASVGDLWYPNFVPEEYHRMEPMFDNNTIVNNTVQLGGTAFLHCRVRNLGERTELPGALTGHGPFNRHTVGVKDSPAYDRCGEEDEMAAHFLGIFSGYARTRFHIFDKELITEEDFRRLDHGSILRFIKGDWVLHEGLGLRSINKQVTWIRRRDWHILTSGMFTYTNDERFQVLHAEGTDDWTLQIKYVQKRDNGTYECQVSTQSGVMSHFANLEIVVPEAFIVGATEYHVVLGGTINLVCVIEKSPTPPQYVLWYHNSKMINYDTSRGGVQVRTEQGQKTESHLTIHEAKFTDSGNYTCSASNTQPAYIHVFVSEGDKMAAISRRKSSSSGPIISGVVWYIALPLLLHRITA